MSLTINEIITGAIVEEIIFRFTFFLFFITFADSYWKDDVRVVLRGGQSFNDELVKKRLLWAFLLTSSYLFCIIHINQWELFSIQLYLGWYIYYFAGGMILGLLFLRHGLFATIVVHGCYNFIAPSILASFLW